MTIRTTFERLEVAYGYQGWWPLLSRAGKRGYDSEGYVRSPPGTPLRRLTSAQRFEVVLGAILTQNTAWENAKRAVSALFAAGITEPERVFGLPDRRLAELIRPSGYFNQKAKKITIVSRFLAEGRYLEKGVAPARGKLLALWGVGEETADSILLYAFGEPAFVIDAYTRRIFSRLGKTAETATNAQMKEMVEAVLQPDPELFGEYHGLIVRHAKEHCRKRPLCVGCPLRRSCRYPERPGHSPES